jgi:hypothetical protein
MSAVELGSRRPGLRSCVLLADNRCQRHHRDGGAQPAQAPYPLFGESAASAHLPCNAATVQVAPRRVRLFRKGVWNWVNADLKVGARA